MYTAALWRGALPAVQSKELLMKRFNNFCEVYKQNEQGDKIVVNIDIGISLGTSNTVIYIKDKGIVVNQPSVVAYEVKGKKIIAVGNKAKKMMGKTPEEIAVVRPISQGVISDYTLTERMIKAYV